MSHTAVKSVATGRLPAGMVEKQDAERRHAQLGLAAAAMLLIGCLSILFVQDRTAARLQGPGTTPSTGMGSSSPTVSAVTPKL